MIATTEKRNKNVLKGLNKGFAHLKASDSEGLIFSCKYCGGKCLKNGIEKTTQKQRYICKECGKRQQFDYTYNGYDKNLNQNIVALTKEGVGIRGIGRLLGISINTVSKKIKEIAENIKEPALEMGKTYEVDEMRTFVKKKKS